jgi:AcrR family transcriptional regulator
MADGKTRRSAAETRAHLLTVARQLFYWQGIHSTGVDKLAAEAKVPAATLYRLFASKDDLVTAYVVSNAEPYKAWMAAATDPEGGPPRHRILALFDALAEQVKPDNCRGCPFLMVLAEFPDRAHPASAEAVALKAWVREHLRQLTRDLAAREPVADPDALADQLAIVVEGVYASVQALGDSGPARQARALAVTLLDAASAPKAAAGN